MERTGGHVVAKSLLMQKTGVLATLEFKGVGAATPAPEVLPDLCVDFGHRLSSLYILLCMPARHHV
jgi:hypothetical protein